MGLKVESTCNAMTARHLLLRRRKACDFRVFEALDRVGLPSAYLGCQETQTRNRVRIYYIRFLYIPIVKAKELEGLITYNRPSSARATAICSKFSVWEVY